ncbi:MAG: adenylate cyclase, partial [Pirellulaceae bacterium]
TQPTVPADAASKTSEATASPSSVADQAASIAALEAAKFSLSRDSAGWVKEAAVSTDGDLSAAMKHLAGLPRLESIRFSGPGMRDAGLEVLAELPSLKRADFTDSAIADETLGWLGKSRNLEALFLRRTGFTDRGLA